MKSYLGYIIAVAYLALALNHFITLYYFSICNCSHSNDWRPGRRCAL